MCIKKFSEAPNRPNGINKRLPMVQIQTSQVPSKREFPKFLKIHPTFFSRSRLREPSTKQDMLSDCPCNNHKIPCKF